MSEEGEVRAPPGDGAVAAAEGGQRAVGLQAVLEGQRAGQAVVHLRHAGDKHLQLRVDGSRGAGATPGSRLAGWATFASVALCSRWPSQRRASRLWEGHVGSHARVAQLMTLRCNGTCGTHG